MVFIVMIHSRSGRLFGKAIVQADSIGSAMKLADRFTGAYDGREVIKVKQPDAGRRILLVKSYG